MEQRLRSRLAPRLLACALALAAAAPAAAQSLAPSSRGLTKSDAILGGAPSQLALILAAQSASASVAAGAIGTAFPANFTRPALMPITSAPQPDIHASADRPDVFNSVAIPLARSPLDARWNRVASGAVRGRAAAFATALRGVDAMARIESVNAFVNARVAFADDSRRFGVADHWSPAAETLASGRGDCEDYAIAKLALLRRAGFADKDLYLVVLKDLARRADHAVLVVRSEGRFLVLDNGSDRVLDSADIADYRPILTFTAGHRFTHGYRRDAVAAPIVIASAEPISTPAIVALAAASGMPSSPFAARR